VQRRQWLLQTAAVGASALGKALVRPAFAAEEQSLPLLPAPLLDLDTLSSADASTCRTTTGDVASLTLDPHLQHCASELLRLAHPLSGAALVVDAKTGRLLCCHSFVRGQSRGTPNPLITPAPAASVFKLITTAALLDGGHVDPKTRVCFSGGERQIDRHHLEPPTHTDACPPFLTALGFSRNAVYAQLATQQLTRQALLEKAETWGFNRPLPFDATATVGHLELPYNDLEFARAAAGFIGSDLTPLGAAHLALTVANQGRPPQMRLIERLEGHVTPTEPVWLPRVMSNNTAWRMTRMMEVTVHSGTSLEAFSRPDAQSYLGPIRVAGKTGTLQRGKSAPTTSWFTGFAPSREPKFVVTVLLQNSPLWRRKANEVARDLLRVVFAGTRGVSHPFEGSQPAEVAPSSSHAVALEE
jgi:penicillin-binding protein A